MSNKIEVVVQRTLTLDTTKYYIFYIVDDDIRLDYENNGVSAIVAGHNPSQGFLLAMLLADTRVGDMTDEDILNTKNMPICFSDKCTTLEEFIEKETNLHVRPIH